MGSSFTNGRAFRLATNRAHRGCRVPSVSEPYIGAAQNAHAGLMRAGGSAGRMARSAATSAGGIKQTAHTVSSSGESVTKPSPHWSHATVTSTPSPSSGYGYSDARLQPFSGTPKRSTVAAGAVAVWVIGLLLSALVR